MRETNTVDSFRQDRTVEDTVEYNPLALCTRAKATYFSKANRKSGRELLVYHSAWDKPYSHRGTLSANEMP